MGIHTLIMKSLKRFFVPYLLTIFALILETKCSKCICLARIYMRLCSD